jgi:YihY family inner membrane protein
VTTARTVPVTTDMSGDELSAEDAWHTVRRHGLRRLVVDAFARFRFGDGFTASRALGLQTALSLVPFLVGLTGLAAELDAQRAARVLASTISELTPGGRRSDVLSHALAPSSAAERAGELALWFGVVAGLVSMTLALAQIERGANRIYGISRDRPGVPKYTRAAVLTAVLALPVALGFLLLVAGGPLGDAMQQVYGWSEAAETTWDIARWPVGVLVTTLAVTVVMDYSPRRRQPSLSWLALGAGLAVALSMLASGLLAVYVTLSSAFGNVYGPLAGMIALLVWSNLTAIALFFGIAVAAHLEGLRAGVTEPVVEDPGPTTETQRAEAAG